MTGVEAEVVVPLAAAAIAAVPATLTILVTVRKVRSENTADHGRVRERLEELTAIVASSEASNLAGHERLAGEVNRVADRFEAHAADEEDIHRRLGMWLLRQDA